MNQNPPGLPPYNGQGQQMPPQGLAQGISSPISSATNEELIEAIIDEKWTELVKDVTTIIEWKNATESKIKLLDQQIGALKADFDKLHQAVIGKVSEYDQHILDVGAEIKAMEKVFSKVLPVFTQNVSELSKVTDDIKSSLGKN